MLIRIAQQRMAKIDFAPCGRSCIIVHVLYSGCNQRGSYHVIQNYRSNRGHCWSARRVILCAGGCDRRRRITRPVWYSADYRDGRGCADFHRRSCRLHAAAPGLRSLATFFPLLDQPPLPCFRLTWDARARIWQSRFHLELPQEMRAVFAKWAPAVLLLSSVVATRLHSFRTRRNLTALVRQAAHCSDALPASDRDFDRAKSEFQRQFPL